MTAPVALVPIDPPILSCYGKKGGTGGPRSELIPLHMMKAGVCVAEVAVALKKLNDAVLLRGGDFRVTELHRDIAVQAGARKKYDNWVVHGKPTGAAFDSKTMKAAFVALPGRSGHNAGRSIDVDLASLKFPGVPADKQLDTLWEIAKPLGWTPIIKEAKEGASESWHFDYCGDLAGVLKRKGYETWARVGAVLVGHGDIGGFDAIVQALLIRAGFDVVLDGAIGPKTRAAVEDAVSGGAKAVESKDVALFDALLALPAG